MGRDLERSVPSSYNWGGISKCLFEAIISAEEYNKGWEGSVGSCSELLYWRRDIILAERYNKGVERYGESCSEL